MLHRILQRNCTGFCSAPEMIIGYLQIMLRCDLHCVPQPLCDDMGRKGFCKFRLAAGPQIVE